MYILAAFVLGPGESGKSTILKQMRIIHAKGFSKAEAGLQIGPIRQNLVQSMANIVEAMNHLRIPFGSIHLEKDAEIVLKIAKNVKQADETGLNVELREAIKHLWSNPAVQLAYERRSEYQLNDSAKYFFEAVDRICSENYLPTQDDIIRCRIKTTGVTEIRFKVEDNVFRVMDVGGQRSERKKWIHCFDNVESIIFITSLSEYDQTLEEDNETKRMSESLHLFSWIINHQSFATKPIVLFLNKLDLFNEKVEKVPITIMFPNYTGLHVSENVLEFIKEQYVQLNATSTRTIYCYDTCATDTGQVSYAIKATINSIVEQNLGSSGFS